MSARSILFSGTLPYEEPETCKPGRQESFVTIKKDGRLYRFVVRDKICVEDPYLVMVKAAAFAIAEGEPYSGQTPERSVRDFLIKTNIVI